MDEIVCRCGCGQRTLIDSRGRSRKYVRGHPHQPRHPKPTNNNRTSRGRARKLCDCSRCELAHIGGCLGIIEVHHKDKNPLNNEPINIVPLCMTHHKLVERGWIDLADPKMPAFVIRGGIRRYLHSYTSMSRSEGCTLREARKRERRLMIQAKLIKNVRTLRSSGLSLREIASATGVNRGLVERILRVEVRT